MRVNKQSPIIGYILLLIMSLLAVIITYWLSILKKVFDDSDEYEFDAGFHQFQAGRVSPYEVRVNNDDFVQF